MSEISDLIAAQGVLLGEIGDLFAKVQVFYEEASNIYAGTATGGPNGDGLYPTTDAAGVVRMQASIAKIQAMIGSTDPLVIAADVQVLSLTATHRNRLLLFLSDLPVTVTVPITCELGYTCQCYQEGEGRVSFVSGTGMSNGTLNASSQSVAQGAYFGVVVPKNDGTTGKFILGGDVD